MNRSDLPMLQAYKHVMAARGWLEGVPGATDGPFRDSTLKELAFELEHLARRVRNAGLARGCSPDALERTRQIHDTEHVGAGSGR